MVFLTYSRDDRQEAADVEKSLRECGIPLWRDMPQPESDPFWRQALLEPLQNADALLVLWSENARRSPWVDEEIRTRSTGRIWFRMDNAPLPPCAQPNEIRCREWNDVVKAVPACIGGTSALRSSVLPDFEPAWRRHSYIDAAERRMLDFVKQPQPDVELVEVSEGVLRHVATGMGFRHLYSDIFLATTSVTAAQFSDFIWSTGFQAGSSTNWSAAGTDAPVVCVTWFEAMACSYWLGGTLPFENEWERAAAAGQELEYGTSTGKISPALAYYGQEFARGFPLPQSAHPPNSAGYSGMCGNTWDWCLDRWGDHRVIRGGCWMDSEQFCRVGARYRNAPVDRDCAVGFRVRISACRKRGDVFQARRTFEPR